MFHKEGFNIIILFFIVVSMDVIILEVLFEEPSTIKSLLQTSALILLLFILWFFRNPKRKINKKTDHIISPADGRVVNIQQTFENEYFKENKLQVSIFLSPFDVHVNRYPVSGEVLYSKYHHGKYLVAWHPKSSDKNERTTIVIKNKNFGNIMYRQIAGMVARRIVNYANEGLMVAQGEDSGFIKFGSRVDLFLPLNSQLLIKEGDRVIGGISEIAKLGKF
jgi:phosphatidylserine decarboxylase